MHNRWNSISKFKTENQSNKMFYNHYYILNIRSLTTWKLMILQYQVNQELFLPQSFNKICQIQIKHFPEKIIIITKKMEKAPCPTEKRKQLM